MSLGAVGVKIIPVILLLLAGAPAYTAQVVPGVEIDCQDSPVHLDSSPTHPTRSTSFECEVENTSSAPEEIEIQYSFDQLAVAGPSTILIGAGGTNNITVQARAPVHMEAGDYEVSVNAVVRKVAGVSAGFLAQSDSDSHIITVDSYTDCSIYDTPEEVKIGADRTMGFDFTLECSSNVDASLDINFVMIEVGKVSSNNSGAVHWPDGFEDKSPECVLEAKVGYTLHDCSFVATSTSLSLSPLDVCLGIQTEAEELPNFCSSNMINVEKSLLGVGASGPFGILITIILIVCIASVSYLFWKRRSSEYDTLE